ncbi:MAG: Zn-dependent hydrolase [Pseudomonadota bacterium]
MPFNKLVIHAFVLVLSFLLAACGKSADPTSGTKTGSETPTSTAIAAEFDLDRRLADYAPFTLTADLAALDQNQRQMIVTLIDAAKIMDGLFWRQAFSDDYAAWLAALPSDAARRFAAINYGPWDRLAANAPWIDGVGSKPKGANLYPSDMTAEEFNASTLSGKQGLYSLLRRDADGALTTLPYHVAYQTELARAAELLRAAADLSSDAAFQKYLLLRADALLSGEYRASDLAWMDSKTSPIDVVIGPIETYEDQLFGYRAAFEAYVLLKDTQWSERLARFSAFLPELQRNLPVPDAYKQESPGTDSDLNAYDVLYYAGDSNAGSKTIAINLPNDETVQLAKGTRRLQLKNAMRAKFDKILVPIAGELIDPEQRSHITFDAFFANTMFHEVAHGLGIKNTLDGGGTVRESLLDVASSMEEGKADVLGLFMITQLHAAGELGDVDLMDNYVTFMASIFRSIRFGATSAHGKANMVRFNVFLERGAMVRDETTGTYRIDADKMTEAMNALARQLLVLQGDGDYEGAKALTTSQGVIGDVLQSDLDRLASEGIPVDIVFEQGVDVLGL